MRKREVEICLAKEKKGGKKEEGVVVSLGGRKGWK